MTEDRHHPLASCEECPLYENNRYVPTEFPQGEAKLAFVGQSPGVKESATGRPFVGISGKLLEAVMDEHGLSRAEAMLTNLVSCRHPSHDEPPPEAIDACSGRLEAELDQARPKYVVSLGRFSSEALTPKSARITSGSYRITKERAGPPKKVDGKPYKLIPTIHPAACLRNTGHFPNFAKDVGKAAGKSISVTWEPPRHKVFDEPGQAKIAIKQVGQRNGPLGIDLETGKDKEEDSSHPGKLLAAGLCYEPGKVAVIGENALRSMGVRRKLAEVLEDKDIVCQNGKYDLGVLHRLGIGTFPLFYDTMLASYSMDERRGVHSLEYMGQEELGTPNWKKEVHDKGFEKVDRKKLYQYNAYDAAIMMDLMELQLERMDNDADRLHDYLCWVSDYLMLVEDEGVQTDVPLLESVRDDLSEEVEELVETLQGQVHGSLKGQTDEAPDRFVRLIREGEGFNPNSPDQVKYFLHWLGFEVGTTNAEMLNTLKGRRRAPDELIEFCEHMLQYRDVTTLLNTFVRGWLRRADPQGRIYPSYRIHGTETGRLSCADPNIQNPPRGEFRNAVIPEPGNTLIYADYANIEGRVVCVLCKSESMRDAMAKGRDIHSELTRQVFGPDFTKEQRVLGKTVTHGANYGRGPAGIARGLEIPRRRAQRAYDTYHEMYPEVKEYQEDTKRIVFQTDDPLSTPWGRKRRFWLITSENAEDIYKEALAFRPQSIGSDICLTAGIRLKKRGYNMRVFIHDGLVAEVPNEHVESATREMVEVMEQSGREFSDFVPFPVDIATGQSWGECV